MAFFFTCGTHTFNSLLSGYENITVQCQNCGNFSGKVTKRWEWYVHLQTQEGPVPEGSCSERVLRRSLCIWLLPYGALD